ncbi:MAG: hypothetical protein Q9166_002374 [cf. Caloplaca sp. 2 TL-2023]
MSFGASATDIIAIPKMAWEVYCALKEAPTNHKHLEEEVLSLYRILSDLAHKMQMQTWWTSNQLTELARIMIECNSALKDVDAILKKYSVKKGRSRICWRRARFAAVDLTPLRARITANVSNLNTFNTLLVIQKVEEISRALNTQRLTASSGRMIMATNVEHHSQGLNQIQDTNNQTLPIANCEPTLVMQRSSNDTVLPERGQSGQLTLCSPTTTAIGGSIRQENVESGVIENLLAVAATIEVDPAEVFDSPRMHQQRTLEWIDSSVVVPNDAGDQTLFAWTQGGWWQGPKSSPSHLATQENHKAISDYSGPASSRPTRSYAVDSSSLEAHRTACLRGNGENFIGLSRVVLPGSGQVVNLTLEVHLVFGAVVSYLRRFKVVNLDISSVRKFCTLFDKFETHDFDFRRPSLYQQTILCDLIRYGNSISKALQGLLAEHNVALDWITAKRPVRLWGQESVEGLIRLYVDQLAMLIQDAIGEGQAVLRGDFVDCLANNCDHPMGRRTWDTVSSLCKAEAEISKAPDYPFSGFDCIADFGTPATQRIIEEV